MNLKEFNIEIYIILKLIYYIIVVQHFTNQSIKCYSFFLYKLQKIKCYSAAQLQYFLSLA